MCYTYGTDDNDFRMMMMMMMIVVVVVVITTKTTVTMTIVIEESSHACDPLGLAAAVSACTDQQFGTNFYRICEARTLKLSACRIT